MNITWLSTPYVDLKYVSTKLYGQSSRLHIYRLRKKINSAVPFEPWEVQKLECMKHELLHHIREGSPET